MKHLRTGRQNRKAPNVIAKMRAFEALKARKSKKEIDALKLAPHSFSRRVVVSPSGRSPDLARGNESESELSDSFRIPDEGNLLTQVGQWHLHAHQPKLHSGGDRAGVTPASLFSRRQT